jgi:hypothetical protein
VLGHTIVRVRIKEIMQVAEGGKQGKSRRKKNVEEDKQLKVT